MIPLKITIYLSLCVLNAVATVKDNENNSQTEKDTVIKPVPKALKVSEFYIGDLLRTLEKEPLQTSNTIRKPVSATPEITQIAEETQQLSSNIRLRNQNIPNYIVPLEGRYPIKRVIIAPVYDNPSLRQNEDTSAESNTHNIPNYAPPRPKARKVDCKKHKQHRGHEEESDYSEEQHSNYRGRVTPPSTSEYRVSPTTYREEYEPGVYSNTSPSHSQSYPSDEHSNSRPSNSNSYPSQSYSNSGPSSSKSYKSESYSDGGPPSSKDYQSGGYGGPSSSQSYPSEGYSNSDPSNSKSYATNTRTRTKSGDSYTTSKSTSKSHTVIPGKSNRKIVAFEGGKPKKHSHKKNNYPEENGGDSYKEQSPENSPYSEEESPQYTSGPRDPSRPIYYQSYLPQKAPFTSRPKLRKQQQYITEVPDSSQYENYEEKQYGPPQHASEEKYEDTRYVSPISLKPQEHQKRDREPPSGYSSPARPTKSQHIESTRPGGHAYYVRGRDYQQERPKRQRTQHGRDTYPQDNGQGYERKPRTQIAPHRGQVPTRKHQTAEERDHYSAGRSSDRSTRTATQYPVEIAERRTPSPHQAPRGLVSVKNEPYVGPVSYSESNYNQPASEEEMTLRKQLSPDVIKNPLAAIHNAPIRETEMLTRNPEYQSSYKPYNSEYPATYANDGRDRDVSHEEKSFEDSRSIEEGNRPYNNQGYDEENYNQDEPPPPPPSTHKVNSDISGYKETYSSSEPLELDEEFFRKYGISKNAKIIYASAKEPNLFIADGTLIPEKHAAEDTRDEDRPEPQNNSEEEGQYRGDTESYNPSQEPPKSFLPPQEAPKSFSQLVNTDPKFLRNLGSKGGRVIGQFNDYDPTIRELAFQANMGDDPKAYVLSRGHKMVQQHGDGVSTIIFNSARRSSKDSTGGESDSNAEHRRSEPMKEAKSEKVETAIKVTNETVSVA